MATTIEAKARRFADGDKCFWSGRLVTIQGARFDYPISSLKWDGTPKDGAKQEWLYYVFGSGREVRERYLSTLGQDWKKIDGEFVLRCELGSFHVRRARGPGTIRGEGDWELMSPWGFGYYHTARAAKEDAERLIDKERNR